ncbi:methionyl-tRNA formyltransferase [Cellulomonas fengjieae]|uniref:Methionyl-tRNA formyltransferase n=1 Tax=Cellulomonas fengjieae TaxID=2819978 RepID=A0ABS3SJ92_9CELL|nr:methionyl-tRNA formyltransferase [Cellulomonas fengjieae]MBO3085574.1 methionyl-tRNA formyltransferase [Cellulomonas fengjieae]MBO3102682.1 methionyl-tRNA formyltransferase [Cellulomonas fengjieae]QVI67704.1 methionyl-tRNA formyltransferase [Cellulomonas fengjieae]
MRLLFAGTPAAAVPSLEALLDSRHEIVAVLTRPDARSGRGRSSAQSAVKARALEAGLEVLTPQRPRDEEFQARLAELAVDAAPVVAYGALIPPALLDVPTHGWVNLHFSVLPAWRGAAPVQHAIISGDEVTGASTFRLEAGLDTGPVFGFLTETIRPRDTAGDLLDRLAIAGAGLLVQTLDALEDGILSPVPQATDGVSHAPKIEVEDARVRWSHPAHAVDRLVRGCTPAPGAWTTLPDGSRLGLAPVVPMAEVTDLAPGRLRAGKNEVLVGTGGHAVRLTDVTPQGKRTMAAADWARGARLADDTVLGGGA